jgi:pentose-5-phosphate-3-epimerase
LTLAFLLLVWRFAVLAALNPATSLIALDELVHYVDGVNLMMVTALRAVIA